jgi:uncharacterized membrane protein YheB (UPF0754 family)
MFVTLAFLLVLLSAFGGWCIAHVFIKILFKPYSPKKITGFTVQGIVPFILNNQSHLIAAAIRQEFLSEKLLQQVLDNPKLLQQMAPAIEAHVDLFLNEKLSEAFPLLYKFMGEKTLQKFKNTFLQEVETILPNMLQQYGTMLLQSNKIEQGIADHISQLSAPQLEANLHRFADHYFRWFKIVATLLGTLIGLLQTVLVYLLMYR